MRNLARRSYDEDGGVAPAAAHVPTTLTMIKNEPSPTPTMTSPDQGEDVVEGEIASSGNLPGEFKCIT
jgi:hypothetical protein